MHVATAFPRVALRGGIAQEILQRLQHERTKPSTTPIGTLEETTFKHHNKKILRQILGVGNGIALLADESENRPPINFAKLGECFARLLLVAARIRTGQDNAPPRRHEAVGVALVGSGSVRVQGRPSSHLREH